ncbi:MAG TPA: carboxypeptidase-like regulatory domain-containing protein, partial [Candidatus Eisenbacteria bacterium]|nr:carboxypeptidase-like regulatory domain-containing protein [Candidatus Eisenbacteria bacterium]
MRAPLGAALILLSPLLTSCADMPTAPRAMVPVSGTILDRDGNPLQAVYVFFEDLAPTPKGTYHPLYDAVTNINGIYSGSIPEGRYNIYISPPSFSAYAPLLIRSKEIGRAGIHLDHRFDWVRLALRPTISGGQPVSALQAMVWPDSPRDFIWQQDLRLAGNVREVFVPPGTYVLYMDVGGKGFSYPHQERRGVTVSADTTIDVAFSGNAVTMHVTGQGGLAYADA